MGIDIKKKIKDVFLSSLNECLEKYDKENDTDNSVYIFGKDKIKKSGFGYSQFFQCMKMQKDENGNNCVVQIPCESDDNLISKYCDINNHLSFADRMMLSGINIQEKFNECLNKFSVFFANNKQVEESDVCFVFQRNDNDIKITPFYFKNGIPNYELNAQAKKISLDKFIEISTKGLF